jgi:hypothetical protein
MRLLQYVFLCLRACDLMDAREDHNAASSEHMEAGGSFLVPSDRLLRSLGAQHETPFPFWEPGLHGPPRSRSGLIWIF